MDEDNVVVVQDTDPKAKRREFIFTCVNNVLGFGIVIGMGMCICIFGIVQQFIEVLTEFETIRAFVQVFWFQIEWWYWIFPIVILTILFFLVRSYGRRKFENENSIYGP